MAPASVRSRYGLSSLTMIAATTVMLAFVLYFGLLNIVMSGADSFLTTSRATFLTPGISVGDMLTTSSPSSWAAFNFSLEFRREDDVAPELLPRYPDEEQRHFPYPFVSGDLFRFTADFILDENDYRHRWGPGHVGPCQTIFVKNDRLDDFFVNVFPSIQHPFVLIAHNGDDPSPGAYRAHLDDTRIHSWFAQNLDGYEHPKLHAIPIGIANSQWETGKLEKWRQAVSGDLPEWSSRPNLLFISWTDRNNPMRKKLKDKFGKFTHDTVVGEGDHDQFLRNLTRSKFVLSPPGNGVDCHRHWEAIMMGAVPIVLRSGLDPMFEHAPAIIVDDFDDVREDVLRALQPSSSYNRDVIWTNFWLKQIRESAQQCFVKFRKSRIG